MSKKDFFFSSVDKDKDVRPFFSPDTIQPKLKINKPNDQYEQQADRIADAVVQRKCTGCEQEEKLQKKETGNTSQNTQVPDNLTQQLQSDSPPGSRLPDRIQSEMSQKIGTDFSDVNIHTGPDAVQMNRSLGARAFTHGKDIYFNSGEYRPGTSAGKHLLAHELTHVVQQNNATIPDIQRMTIGAGNPPQRWIRQYNARVVPDEDGGRVNSAIEMIREVVTDSEQYSSCHQFFEEHCPNGNEASLSDTFNNAILWKADREGARAFASVPGTNIAYTQSGYDQGARNLAVTLVHELLHNCGIGGDEFHHLADVAGLYCIGNVNEISISAGPAFNADVFYLLYSYRRFLTELGNGQVQLTAGADLNFTGTLMLLSDEEAISEAGSLMAGIRGRTNLFFGGERFGGLTGRIEPGIGIGRFRVRDAETEDTHPEFGAGFILQTGIGAEFYIPVGVNAMPLSVEATYRMVIPLNEPAETIHGILGNVGMRF